MNIKLNFIVVSMLCSFSLLLKASEPSPVGYRVSNPNKTLIQIARDVYNDERLWKKISQWNNVTPPYSLNVDQVLVLPYSPINPIATENEVPVGEVPSPTFITKLPSVEQQILNTKGTLSYVVNERAPSLSMIALENYGNKKMAVVIAIWNGLSPKAKLSLGQKIQLRLAPRFSEKLANATLISQWSKMGNPEMVKRLSGQNPILKIATMQILPIKTKKNIVDAHPSEPQLRTAPVVFDINAQREPTSENTVKRATEQSSASPWFEEKTANSIESLLRSISN